MNASWTSNTQVLVVGAGPVGLMAALRLRHQGVAVRIIDRERSDQARSFPVVIHPQTLRILSALGITSALFWRGRPVPRVAVFVEGMRRATLELPPASNLAVGAMTLPQDILRQALLNALALRGVFVEWSTELTGLEQDDRGVSALLQRAPGSSILSGRGRAEHVSVQAEFVIGADGYQSSVRQLLELPLIPRGRLQAFAFFDAVVRDVGSEAQLALKGSLLSAVYPLSEGRARFSFQLDRDLADEPKLSTLRQLVTERMPWCRGGIEACEWSGLAEFRPALCEHFGRGRVWLAGDAAHSCGPLGVQSLNVGLDEASELGLLIADALRRHTPPSFGPAYDARRTTEWRKLLGLDALAAELVPTWLEGDVTRLLQTLPASARDLEQLLQQLSGPGSAAPRPVAAAKA